jgi:hypothetical protein
VKLFINLLLLLVLPAGLLAQKPVEKIDELQFFADENVMQVIVNLDIRKLMANKLKEGYKFPANFTAKLDDSTEISEPVTLEVRGHFRKENCYMPPLKVNFKSQAAPVLSPLGSLKLVNVCAINSFENTQFLLKEYLIYKLYNLITEKSLRARLLRISYVDSAGKKNTIVNYAFLLEDVKDMAKRNQCVERKREVRHSEATDRKQMTRVALFEYMIANADWSVPARHNIKLIVVKEDTNSIPLAVPYDFDHSGLVKTNYALPPPQLDIKDVTERLYRGFPRSMEELQEVAEEFLKQKDSMYHLIKEFKLLPSKTRSDMISFLDNFFDIISKPKAIKTEFILNARKD